MGHIRMYGDVDTEQRERLLEAALDEFTSRGFYKTKISDLCSRAGVSTRNFYEKFPSKEALLLELQARINTIVTRRLRPVLDELAGAGPLTRITTLLDVFIEAVTADPRFPRLNYVEAPGISVAVELAHREWFARYTAFLEAECDRAADAGLVPRRDYHLTAIALVTAMTGILREWQAHEPPLPVEAVSSEIRAVFLAAITRPA
jgi:AcrR family transcriptional regulator